MKLCLRYTVVLVLLLSFSISAFGNTVNGAPTRLRWNSDTIHISVSRGLLESSPNIKSGNDVIGAIRRSLGSWQQVSGLKFELTVSDKVSVSPSGVAGDGVSLITTAATPENVLLFGNKDETLSAKTRVFYDDRGFIREADIVLNPFQQFSTDGTFGTFDLETTLTHELGHLIGLRHSSIIGSIMYDVSARNGDLGMFGRMDRVISADDVAAVRDLYDLSKGDDCCGSISGNIKALPRNIRTAEVWVEDSTSGIVSGHGSVGKTGGFRIAGIPSGSYRVFLRTEVNDRTSVYTLGESTVIGKESSEVNSAPDIREPGFSIYALGTNGIMGDGGLSFAPGGVYSVYVGGEGLLAGNVSILVTSPSVRVLPGSVAQVDYAEGVTVLRTQVRIDEDAPPGNFSVCAMDGVMADCMPGGITVQPGKTTPRVLN